MWEYLLHDTLLKDWKHHTEKIKYIVEHFNGELWPGRLIGFGIGAILFAILTLISCLKIYLIKFL